MNPMMQALEQSRQGQASSPVPPSKPGVPPQTGQDDMAKYWSMMQDMNAKLDKLIEVISGVNSGKTAPQEDEESEDDVKENESNGNGY